MKSFMRFSMIAVAIVLVAVMASMFVAPVSAASGDTIYISDTGTGDGTTDTKAMGPEERVKLDTTKTCTHEATAEDAAIYYCSCFKSVDTNFCANSVLYQAAEKLAQTGGTIVLVGDVKIDRSVTASHARFSNRDFYMPTHGDNQITIKGQGGKLILEEGAMFNLGGYTVFENIEIKTEGHEHNSTTFEKIAICASGYKAVFESTVTCSAEEDVGAQYPTLAGGNRYGALKGDTDLTIGGGTWYGACGSNYGNPGDKHEGDSKLTISGGTFKYYVTAGAWRNGAFQYGDSELYISGGNFGTCCVYSCSNIGVGRKGTTSLIKVVGDGMKLGNGAIRDIWKYDGSPVEGCIKPIRIVDLTECTASNVNKMVVKTGEFVEATDSIYYPTTSVSAVTMVDAPVLPYAFNGDTIKYNATGLSINIEYGVEYSAGKTAKLAYSPEDSNFVISVSNGKVTGTYGGKTITGLSKAVSIVEDPTPKVLGAQISTNNTKGGLRFVAEMSRSIEKEVTVKDYGFYIWDGSVLGTEKIADVSSVYGIEELTAYGTKFREEYDEVGIYNNAEKTTFSAVYDDVQLNDYDKNIVAVAYIEYTYNGKTYTSYSDTVTRTVLGVANSAYGDAQESQKDKEWIKTNIIDKYAEYVSASTNLYDSANADELRDIVVAEMKANAEFAWTPSTDIDLTGKPTVNGVVYSNSKAYTYTAGTTYYGMPYINNAKHELDEFNSFIKPRKDGTNVYYGPIRGINDFGYTGDQATYVEHNKYKLDEKYYEIESFIPASDYTGMIVNVWNKVGTNKVYLTDLTSFFPGKGGTIAVGGYSYTGTEKYTDNIVDENDANTMYAAYAACKKGDVVVCKKSTGGSSIYMIMETPTGNAVAETQLKMLYFSPSLHDKTVNGVAGKTHFQEIVKSFDDLYNSDFIPVTLPELATGTQSKTTSFIVGFDGANAMKTGILSGELISNKSIISVNVKLSRNNNDGEFYNETVYCNYYKDQNVNCVELSQFDMSKVLPYLVDGKTYTLTVNADIGNEGVKTIASYSYTEPTVNLSDMYAAYYDSFNVDFSNIKQTPIDHMKEQMEVYWTPATTFQYDNLTNDDGFVPTTKFVAGTIYKGILYANTRATLADFKAALGSSYTNKTVGGNTVKVYTLGANDSNYSGTTDWNWVVGNHCSAAMYHGYQKVSRLHASSRGNPNMKLLGLKDLYYGVSSFTNSVMKLYGAEAMYESYALAQPGDFMYRTQGGGHTRMVQSVNVVRNNTTGKIDPDKSYVLMIEQTNVLESKDGYQSTWWEHQYTFNALANNEPSSIILRPHEFMTNETEEQYVGLTKLATKSLLESPNYYNLGFVESNYPIIAVRATITDTNGKVLDKVENTGLTSINNYNVGKLFTTKTGETVDGVNDNRYLNNTTDEYLCVSNYKGKSYTYTLEVELAAGKAIVQTLNVTA